MDGQIDWAAIPILAPMFGVDDIEVLVAELVAVRKHVRLVAENG